MITIASVPFRPAIAMTDGGSRGQLFGGGLPSPPPLGGMAAMALLLLLLMLLDLPLALLERPAEAVSGLAPPIAPLGGA